MTQPGPDFSGPQASATVYPGALPVDGPPHMLLADPDEAVAAASQSVPYRPATWWHQTEHDKVGRILRRGLLPGCWIGHDTCVVFGVDQRPTSDDGRIGGDVAIVEVHSPVPRGDVKALWVPANAIRGFWHAGSFTSRADALAAQDTSDWSTISTSGGSVAGCPCDMARFCAALQEQWRASQLTQNDELPAG